MAGSKNKKSSSFKLSDTEEVQAYITESKHALKSEMELLRSIILSSNKKITEHIKWNAPSFCFDGEDRITFNLTKKDCVQLIFHRGAKVKEVKGNKPIMEDKTGLFEWASQDRAIVKFYNSEEIHSKKNKLKKVIRDWIKISPG
jgi:hypothetical protein